MADTILFIGLASPHLDGKPTATAANLNSTTSVYITGLISSPDFTYIKAEGPTPSNIPKPVIKGYVLNIITRAPPPSASNRCNTLVNPLRIPIDDAAQTLTAIIAALKTACNRLDPNGRIGFETIIPVPPTLATVNPYSLSSKGIQVSTYRIGLEIATWATNPILLALCDPDGPLGKAPILGYHGPNSVPAIVQGVPGYQVTQTTYPVTGTEIPTILATISMSPGLRDPNLTIAANLQRNLSKYLVSSALALTKEANPQLGDLSSKEGIMALQNMANRKGCLLFDFTIQARHKTGDPRMSVRIQPHTLTAYHRLVEARLITCNYPSPSLESFSITTSSTLAPIHSLSISTTTCPNYMAAQELLQVLGVLYGEGYEEAMAAATPELTANPLLKEALILQDNLGQQYNYNPLDPSTMPPNPLAYFFNSKGLPLDDSRQDDTFYPGNFLIGIANNSSKAAILMGIICTQNQPYLQQSAVTLSVSIPEVSNNQSNSTPTHTFSGHSTLPLGNLHEWPAWESSTEGGCMTAVALLATLGDTSIDVILAGRSAEVACKTLPENMDRARLLVITPPSTPGRHAHSAQESTGAGMVGWPTPTTPHCHCSGCPPGTH